MRTRINILTQIFLTLLVAGIGLLWYFTTRINDDLTYAIPYLGYIYGNSDFPGFTPWLEMMKDHYYLINGRLADKFMPLFLLLPRYVFAMLMIACVVTIYRMCCRIALGRISSHPIRATMMAVTIMLIMPWYMRPFLTCMSVNYILTFTSAIWLITIYFKTNVSKPITAWKKIILTIVAFLTAASHEGLVFLLAPGLLLYAAQHRRNITPVQWLILVGGITGTIFIISNPGFWMRLQSSMSYGKIPDLSYCFRLITPYAVYLVCYVVSLLTKRLRFNRESAGIYNMIVIFGALNVIVLFINSETATMFEWTIILSITGIFSLLQLYRPSVRLHRIAGALTFIGACYVLLMTIVAIQCEIIYNHNYYSVVNRYLASPDGVVYFDEERMPIYTPLALNMHSRRAVPDIYTQWREGVNISILPTTLRNFNPAEAKPWNPALNLYRYHGCIVSPDTIKYDYHKGECYIEYIDTQGAQKTDYVNVYTVPSGDGNHWALISPIFRPWYRCPDVAHINYIGG